MSWYFGFLSIVDGFWKGAFELFVFFNAFSSSNILPAYVGVFPYKGVVEVGRCHQNLEVFLALFGTLALENLILGMSYIFL